MSEDTLLNAVNLLEEQIRQLEEQVLKKKRTVNGLCEASGEPPRYADLDEPRAKVGGRGVAIAPDEFFTKPLATTVRAILEKRKAATLGPASLDELYQNMIDGGFVFDAKTETNAKRSLSISLSKNASTFVKLPSGTYGLVDWYPDLPKQRAQSGADRAEGRKANGKGADKVIVETDDDREEFLKGFDGKEGIATEDQ